MTLKLWGDHIAGPVLAVIAIASVVGAAWVKSDPSLAAKLVVCTAWVTGAATVFLMFVAQYDAWKKLDGELQKYAADYPRIGLNVVSFFGMKDWNEQAANKNTPVHFSLQHLSGRIPTDVRFDPIPSKRGKWFLCFGSLPYVNPPVQKSMAYEVMDESNRYQSKVHGYLGWGELLLHFVQDTSPEPEQDEYTLTVRYKDGEEERSQEFKLLFDKARFGFLPNTMHT